MSKLTDVMACNKCGRLLEPYEITSHGRTWIHYPNCYHDAYEEVYGTQMTLTKAIKIANEYIEWKKSQLEEAQTILEELEGLK